ncbi:DUF1284 domain-containing protein [Anaerosporobacter faecicola]|uniref:DUF1284 domain-containing protein n=1 Tax=Anaerosporobacter faecicola TaxID=2718714 RepID=UPI00143C04EA|nr:DUF1284 domain-containing protein [Anaerosporobacter faecicola]
MIPNLRPHHGLCIQFYQGKGYSKEFTDYMTSFVKQIQQEPQKKIKLHANVDFLCNHCPHNIANHEVHQCRSQEKVTRYDLLVLKYCHLEKDQVLTISDFLDSVKKNILEPGKHKEICGDCEWYSLCSGSAH